MITTIMFDSRTLHGKALGHQHTFRWGKTCCPVTIALSGNAIIQLIDDMSKEPSQLRLLDRHDDVFYATIIRNNSRLATLL
jgi:hypothetical protein